MGNRCRAQRLGTERRPRSRRSRVLWPPAASGCRPRSGHGPIYLVRGHRRPASPSTRSRADPGATPHRGPHGPLGSRPLRGRAHRRRSDDRGPRYRSLLVDRRTPISSLTRSRSSSPVPAPHPNRTGYSPAFSSPTSSTRLARPSSSATRIGGSSSIDTTPWPSVRSNAMAVDSSRRPATAYWPRSTVLLVPCGAPEPSVTALRPSASRCGRECTPERSSCEETTSPASGSISRRVSRRWPSQVRFSSPEPSPTSSPVQDSILMIAENTS